MKFGVCTQIDNAQLLAPHGWNYIEPGVQTLLRAQESDATWNAAASTRETSLPIFAANGLLPATLKVVGSEVNRDALATYIETACRRAAQVGIETLVFGSGGARQIPEGFSRETAKQQIIEFLQLSAVSLQKHNVTLVIEPLNSDECNVINSVGEAMEYVGAANHSRVKCLADSYHFWRENDSLDSLRRAAPHITHVHVADLAGRAAPGESGGSDYRDFFAVLREENYRGGISVEAASFDLPQASARVLAFLKAQWESA